jgi:hypothetical protein
LLEKGMNARKQKIGNKPGGLKVVREEVNCKYLGIFLSQYIIEVDFK